MRETCWHCGRPKVTCLCAHIQPVPTVTRVAILQHPREEFMPIGTARMTHLALPNSELHVGVAWSEDSKVARALHDPACPAILLYPGEGAKDVEREPPPGPCTLVVLDGTWSQAKKLLRKNPWLASLPRYAFRPPAPSDYRIRKEPQDDYVSTIEAITHVLGCLEGDAEKVRPLLIPFRAMVDMQIDYRQRLRASRHKNRPRPPKPPRDWLPRAVRDKGSRLVCVVGEANAWPCRDRSRPDDEIVHWSAVRVATGERFEAIVAPRRALSPGTPVHVEIDEATLRNGMDRDAFDAAWRAFVRSDDVIASWGTYATRVLEADGGWLPKARVDVRRNLKAARSVSLGALEDVAKTFGDDALPGTMGPGRAGRRLSALVLATRVLACHVSGDGDVFFADPLRKGLVERGGRQGLREMGVEPGGDGPIGVPLAGVGGEGDGGSLGERGSGSP
ncbi:MAG: tRNA-uridine aminocarboxypropyltransferase [Polyangiaceae bacterium]